MNRIQIKKNSKTGIVIAIAILSLVIITAMTVCAYLFGGDPIHVSVTIFVAILPSAIFLWFLVSLLIYIIEKYRKKNNRTTEINLRISSLFVAALLFIALVLMFISAIGFGIDLIKETSRYF